MRKRLEIGLVMFLIAAITGFLVFSNPLPSPAPGGPPSVSQAVETAPAAETTIRNVTDQSITYNGLTCIKNCYIEIYIFIYFQIREVGL